MIVCSSHVGPSTYFAGSGRHSARQILTKVTDIVNYSVSRPGYRHDPPLGKRPEYGWQSMTAEIHEALIGIRCCGSPKFPTFDHRNFPPLSGVAGHLKRPPFVWRAP